MNKMIEILHLVFAQYWGIWASLFFWWIMFRGYYVTIISTGVEDVGEGGMIAFVGMVSFLTIIFCTQNISEQLYDLTGSNVAVYTLVVLEILIIISPVFFKTNSSRHSSFRRK